MAEDGAPARGRREAPDGSEPEVPPDYAAPGESDVLRDEVDRRIHDVLTGKRKLASYSSADEYLEHLDKVLGE